MLMRKQNSASSKEIIGDAADSEKPAFYAGFFINVGATAAVAHAVTRLFVASAMMPLVPPVAALSADRSRVAQVCPA